MVPKPKSRVDDRVSIAPKNNMQMCVGFIFVNFSCIYHKQMQLKLNHSKKKKILLDMHVG